MVAAADVAMGLNVLVIVCLIIVLGLLFHNTKEAQTAAKNAALTRELAQELRASSDDLTRFIRTYTVTGNYSYWTYFLEVINIRNGVTGLPVQPWRIFWDLYIADGFEPRPRGAPSSINSRFAAAGFTPDELELLEKAKRQSDVLIDVQDVAFHAMQGKYRIGEPGDPTLTPAQRQNFTITGPINQTWAMSLTHGVMYHYCQGSIMRPLDQFAAISSKRVDDDLAAINRVSIALLSVLGASIGILCFIMLLYVFKLRKDQETTSLLNSVLPTHVSSAVTPADVSKLREQASAQARLIRRQNAGIATNASSGTAGRFPVLFHEHLPICWISFADVVGFTRISRVAPCGAMISMLNELFALMDAAAARFRIVKIKCIGDCFMSLKAPLLKGGGKTKSDLKNVSRCGIDMLRFLFHSFELARTVILPFDDVAASEDLPRDLELRAGMNAGPCASGVVGFDKFMYDVFGDTVNTASRFESSGRASCVHTSKEVMGLLDDFKEFIDLFPDGNRVVNLKGIGEVETVLISNVHGPKGDTYTDQGTAVTFAEIHSRGTKTNSMTQSSNSSNVKQVYVKSGNTAGEQLP